MREAFERKIEEEIRRNGLILPGDRVLAGLSGGADSVCLIRVLNALREKMGFSLEAVHVNHGLRETAGRDADFSRALAKRLGIPFHLAYADVRSRMAENGESEEEAARNLRYRAFFDCMEACSADRIAVAHHKNDQAETVLFRLLRGSGLRGLSGMQMKRDALIRPLLAVTKEEILVYLAEIGETFVEDETNEADDADRNKIRHHVIPALEDVRPDAVDRIAETAAYFSEVDAYLREKAEEWLRENGPDLPADALRVLPGIEQEYIAAAFLRANGIGMKDKTRAQLQRVASLAGKQVGKQARLSENEYAVRTYDAVVIRKGPEEEAAPKCRYTMKTRTFPYEKGMEIPEKECTKWFDCGKILGTIVLRNRLAGDIFATRPGRHKKLKDYLIDCKIPKEKRDCLPLVADGNRILWIFGVRMSEDYKITQDTETVLEISIEEDEK